MPASDAAVRLTVDQAKQLIVEKANAGDFEGALQMALAVCNAVPDDLDALELAGAIAGNGGYYENAVDCFQALIDRQPANRDHHDKLIRTLMVHDRASGRLKAAAERALAAVGPDAPFHHALAVAHAEAGAHAEAVAAFAAAVELAPDFVQAYRAMSAPLLAIGRGEDTVAAFSRSLAPWDGSPPPADASATDYDALAAGYDGNALHRRFAECLGAVFLPVIEGRDDLRVLDIGCGTGAVGDLLKGRTAGLAGVDLAPGMIAAAAAKGLYDDLRQGDMAAVMAELDGPFDLITSSCALYHLADLAKVFAEARRLLAPGGIFAVSVDPAADDMEIGVSEPGEYAHSRRYLRILAQAQGFTEHEIRVIEHRRFPGFGCVFFKEVE